MAAPRVAWVAALVFFGLIGVSLAEPSPERCATAEGAAEEDEAVCALQHGSLKKDAASASKQPSVSTVQAEVNLHEHKEAKKAKRTKQVKTKQQSDEAGAQPPWSDDSEDEEEAVADVQDRGFGISDATILNYAEDHLDKLPSKDAFRDQTGWSGLPLTMAFVNDKAVYMVWDSLDEMDGHIFDAPEPGTKIWPGQVVTVQMYANSDGLRAKARLHDPFENWLSVAWQSYRVGSWSCDRLRARAMKTYNWDDPMDVMCNTDSAGIFRRNDYEVIVSLRRAE